MADFDLLVLGGGPAGYAAALRAAELGARVALVEAERVGGACIHHACIPTSAMLGAVEAHIAAREMGVLGVFEAGDTFNWTRAVARAELLARTLADGASAALRMRKVEVIRGRAAFAAPGRVTISGRAGSDVSAEA